MAEASYAAYRPSRIARPFRGSRRTRKATFGAELIIARPSGPCSDSRLVRYADRPGDCIEPCISAKRIVERIGIKEKHKSVPFAGGLFQPLDSFFRLIQADVSTGIIDGWHKLAAVLLPDVPF